MASPFAQLKATYAANKSFHLSFALLIMWVLSPLGDLQEQRRRRVNGACGVLLLTYWKNPFVALLVGPEILPKLYSLHFQLPHTWRGCCWLTDWLYALFKETNDMLGACFAYQCGLAPFLNRQHTYPSPAAVPNHIDYYYYLLISFHSNKRLKVQQIPNQPHGPRNATFSIPVRPPTKSRVLVLLLELAKVHLGKCRRRVLHLNEPVVVFLLLAGAVVPRCWCCPVEWQEENLEIMLFGFAENFLRYS